MKAFSSALKATSLWYGNAYRSGVAPATDEVTTSALSAAPNVPTMAESGFPDLKVGSWQGVFVPKGTPRPVVDRLFTAVVRTMKNPEVVKQLGTASRRTSASSGRRSTNAGRKW